MTLLHEMAYVYEVYRQRSFTRAAQALYISQPSLSQMIRKAEGRIGTTIFVRQHLAHRAYGGGESLHSRGGAGAAN